MKLNVRSPTRIDTQLLNLIEYLSLNSTACKFLEYHHEPSFEAEAGFCHINVMVKYSLEKGTPIFGWMLGQDKNYNFAEAQFHSVWQSPTGKIYDITPRIDNEKTILFLPDPVRRVVLSQHEGKPVLITYDNIRIIGNQMINGLNQIHIIPDTDMFTKYNLFSLSHGF